MLLKSLASKEYLKPREFVKPAALLPEPVETDMADVETDIVDVETDMADVETDMADMETDIVDVETDMADVETDMADVETDIVDVETDILDVETDMADVETDNVDVDSDVVIVETDIETIIIDEETDTSDVEADSSATTDTSTCVESIPLPPSPEGASLSRHDVVVSPTDTKAVPAPSSPSTPPPVEQTQLKDCKDADRRRRRSRSAKHRTRSRKHNARPREKSRDRSRGDADASPRPESRHSQSVTPKPKCKDYNETGDCKRGDQCQWDHGNNPVVFDDNALTSLLAIPQPVPEYNAPIPANWVPPAFNPIPPPPPPRELIPISSPRPELPLPGPSSSHCMGFDDSRFSKGPQWQPQYTYEANCSLELKVPRDLNEIVHLNNHFCKFGKIVKIHICYEGDPEAAQIMFSNPTEANFAYKSTEAVFGNRVIKVFWHSPDEKQAKSVPTPEDNCRWAQKMLDSQLVQQQLLLQKLTSGNLSTLENIALIENIISTNERIDKLRNEIASYQGREMQERGLSTMDIRRKIAE